MNSFVVFAAVPAFSSPAESAPRTTDGILNRGSPLYIPSGVPVAAAVAPALHLPAAVTVPAPPPAPLDPRQYDGHLHVPEPLFVGPAAKFIPPPAPLIITSPPSPPESPKPDIAAHNGVKYEPSPLFKPSEQEQQKSAEERERRFWIAYWEKEQKRQARVAASIFPHPLPKPKEPVEETRPANQPPKTERKNTHTREMAQIMESVVAYAVRPDPVDRNAKLAELVDFLMDYL